MRHAFTVLLELGPLVATVSGRRAVSDWMDEQGFGATYQEMNADHAGMVPLVLPNVFTFLDQPK